MSGVPSHGVELKSIMLLVGYFHKPCVNLIQFLLRQNLIEINWGNGKIALNLIRSNIIYNT